MNRHALTHSLRVTFRFAVGQTRDHPVDVDVAVPAGARLADVLPEVCDVAGVSPPVSPWEARTPAGGMVPTSTPLAWSNVRPGSIITVQDASHDMEPLVASDTEALTQVRRPSGATGYSVCAVATGFVMLLLLLGGYPLALTAAALCCLGISAGQRVAWQDAVRPAVTACMTAGTAVLALLAGLNWVTWTATPPDASLDVASPLISPLGLATAGAAMLFATALSHLVSRPPRAVTVCLITTGLGVCAWAGFSGLAATVGLTTSHSSALAAPTVVAAAPLMAVLALGAVIYGPLVALRSAGIAIPAVPSAGADLSATDLPAEVYAGAGSRARRATSLFDGLVCGSCLLGVAATLLSVFSEQPAPFRLLFTLALVACLAMQSTRYASAVGAWAVWLWSMGTAVATALTVVIHPRDVQPHPAVAGLAFVLAAVCVAAGLWTPRLAHLPPTTIAALEKVESACVIVALPLALYLAGVFAAIRGLG